ncbi:MAG: preprotein translocase subunit SecA [Bacteroidetes bacterium]|jgi:preprotein translocase subunit SecA|nr:preprotein translocase subunit SecA [Bacteroidota bacterium]MBT5530482.1 preprotein translocase subunit SecA [Cytophagia bacterium]MBT3423107.1 preprotein translocase subunit SecA [Bacteroidota bacterium]MBT4339021.1 preprotein translocase subunit SecA [Bacteroidota bacterium]MBT4727415.1 preprotein translocase subunit SecA [Bacteroidota bacterium]
MSNTLAKVLTSVFGNKSDRDVKSATPLVIKINEAYEKFHSYSDDEIRENTTKFRNQIQEHLNSIDDKISTIKNSIDTDLDMQPEDKEELYRNIDKLEKERNEELEKVLKQVLPEAFATMKQVSKRLTENKQLVVTANDRDKELAVSKDYVKIQGDQATYANEWDAAGGLIKWEMVHYDVQLIGGVVLHEGKIAEMATGEGKTLVSTLAAYLNALSGRGVHIVTVNDYLARRDCEWNGPLYEFLGIRVDCIEYHKPNSSERRNAYLADITYGTNNEFGFDYLRDNMARNPEDLVQRKHHYAMVDEVDSVLVDDARTPLIISGPTSNTEKDQETFLELKPRVEKLLKYQKEYVNKALNIAKSALSKSLDHKETSEPAMMLLRAFRGLPKNKATIKFLSESGIRSYMQKVENYFMQEQSKHMPEIDKELYFVIDEKNNSIELTDMGIETITSQGEDPTFFVLPDVGAEISAIDDSELPDNEKISQKDTLLKEFSLKSERIHVINQLLKAYTLFEKDVEYIIGENRIKIVDEQTGRVLEGRRYSDGLHQAIEAKENVKIEKLTQTYATITLQNYFRMYHKLCGMTGTAETEAGEFWQIYKLDVVVIPTNRPIVRDDKDDLIYKTVREKYNAVVDEIEQLVNAGRPILVGTTSVEISELLSKILTRKKIKHNVLNAKQHQREADIVAEAGQAGAVTIATNMAGRGTDIKLREGVVASGGLAIIGTERHDSRRTDRQLRGRAGRQGDPGSSQFYVSLEDNLMRLFGSERIAKYMDRLGLKDGDVIQHSMISKSIERAQKKVEENNFGIRKRLLEYDDVMNSQREVIYTRRRNALYGDRLEVDINNMLRDFCDDVIDVNRNEGDFDSFSLDVVRYFATQSQITADEFKEEKQHILADKLFVNLKEAYNRKVNAIAEKAFPVIKRVYEDRGKVLKYIVVPFSDGKKAVDVLVDLEKAYKSKGKEILKSFEKMTTLSLIDDFWKEHLRELDDLKQSVQNVTYEQKDPILIYKLESFKLFETVLGKVSREVLPMIFKGDILTQDPDDVSEGTAKRGAGLSNLKESRPQDFEGTKPPVGATNAEERKVPVRVEKKVGRNDPCPCGSGKKYKSCHGE